MERRFPFKMEAMQKQATLLLSLLPLLFQTSLSQIPAGRVPVPAFPTIPNVNNDPLQPAAGGAGERATDYPGRWEMANVNAGVSSMHMQLMPLTGKVIMFDATYYGASALNLPPDNCRMDPIKGMEDCFAHSIEFDIATGKVRPLKILTDTWCSSGSLSPNGTLVNSGGWADGTKALRFVSSCDTCDWTEFPVSLAMGRWYATQQLLPDERFILIGGRQQFNFEFLPPPGVVNRETFPLPLLAETNTPWEDNLYPFVHLLPDGNLFVFANNRSVLLNPVTHAVVRDYPVLADGTRNYPGSGMSALLPLKLSGSGTDPAATPAEVIVCGGSPYGATAPALDGKLVPALRSCGRITVTAAKPEWIMEQMPYERVMSDMLVLPTGDLILINGAKRGVSGWTFAEDPAFEPFLYRTNGPEGNRFRMLAPTTIARMYHSTSAVLPDGTVLVAGSNTNDIYKYTGVAYPTELRVEKFHPPYLDPATLKQRPSMRNLAQGSKFGYKDAVQFRLLNGGVGLKAEDVEVTMYAPPFTTHGYSMNQRLLSLNVEDVNKEGLKAGRYAVKVTAPATAALAPPGYYLFFVVARGLPSKGIWIQMVL